MELEAKPVSHPVKEEIGYEGDARRAWEVPRARRDGSDAGPSHRTDDWGAFGAIPGLESNLLVLVHHQRLLRANLLRLHA